MLAGGLDQLDAREAGTTELSQHQASERHIGTWFGSARV